MISVGVKVVLEIENWVVLFGDFDFNYFVFVVKSCGDFDVDKMWVGFLDFYLFK